MTKTSRNTSRNITPLVVLFGYVLYRILTTKNTELPTYKTSLLSSIPPLDISSSASSTSISTEETAFSPNTRSVSISSRNTTPRTPHVPFVPSLSAQQGSIFSHLSHSFQRAKLFGRRSKNKKQNNKQTNKKFRRSRKKKT